MMQSDGEAGAMVRIDRCTLGQARRVAAMLDRDPDGLSDGQPLPRGWHFFLLGGDTRRSDLRGDGFPGLGVAMPDLGLPRLLLAGRSIDWSTDLIIGDQFERRSRIESISEKDGSRGRMALVKLRHEFVAPGSTEASMVETQTYALLPAGSVNSASAPLDEAASGAQQLTRTMTPDETLLFQYSALGFNSHKIHLDRDHARSVEGLPDLVVNGGLISLLATEFLRDQTGVEPKALTARHLAPLYCNHPIKFCASRSEMGWHVRVLDHRGVRAAEIEVKA